MLYTGCILYAIINCILFYFFGSKGTKVTSDYYLGDPFFSLQYDPRIIQLLMAFEYRFSFWLLFFFL